MAAGAREAWSGAAAAAPTFGLGGGGDANMRNISLAVTSSCCACEFEPGPGGCGLPPIGCDEWMGDELSGSSPAMCARLGLCRKCRWGLALARLGLCTRN